MSKVGQIERVTQNRVITLFHTVLGYEYLGNWADRKDNSNIKKDLLNVYLQSCGYTEDLITRAIEILQRAAEDQIKSPYDVNKNVYTLLRYGVQVKTGIGENTQTVRLINWDQPEKNHFGVAEEVTINGEHAKRPDIVLYVNGIALGILELKRSTVSVSEGIRQNLDNQKALFIRHFFSTSQLIMAGNDTEGLRYGVIETPEKYYLTWKEDSTIENLLDRHLSQICAKDRFLELIHDFIVFDAGKKKICRTHQYFGVKAAQRSLSNKEGGIIWHSQGSGKSLTMIWLAKWIREHMPNSRVLIITDRTELDEQIEKVFKGIDEQIYRTTSSQDLIQKLNATIPLLICSLIHKFGSQKENKESDADTFADEMVHALPPNFSPKGNIYVFVDECHRTQSGKFNSTMKKVILPNATFIGFTGTPLLKTDKTSVEVFGKYIHTYKFNEAVQDKVVLDLLYEARDVDQIITSQDKIDQWFEAKTRGLNDVARAQLKKKWGTMQNVLSSKERLERIVGDILLDMETKDRLVSGHGNALLVSGSIYQACKYYQLFKEHGFDKCAIVTSYKPSIADIKGEETGEGPTDKLDQYKIYTDMLNGRDVEQFEQEAKDKFIHDPGQMKLLIVVDKLLTGFDAPPATYLYIDKEMRDHGLFQAICRVNRLDGEDKQYGCIIDYKDLFKRVESAIQDYTSEALSGYAKEDVEGLLSDRLAKGRERLEAAREAVKALCEPVAPPKNLEDYLRYFCVGDAFDKDALQENEPKRITLYKLIAALVRSYANIANEMLEAGYNEQERKQISDEVTDYEHMREEIKLASGDYINLKLYEPAMRHLIDAYIHASESAKISAFDDVTLLQLIAEQGLDALNKLPEGIAASPEATAETIENNMRRVITDQQVANPRYYEKMSALLDALIRQRKEKAIAYEQYLKDVVDLARQVQNPAASAAYPSTMDTLAKRVLYDNLDNDETLAIAVDDAIHRTRQDGWRDNVIREREVLYGIQDVISDESKAREIFNIARNQNDY